MKSCPECFSEYEDSVERCPDDSATLKSIDKDPLVGTRLADRYEVLGVVGRGGMGVVYKVRHELMDRFMAVKMLHSHLVSEPEAVKRFHREAKTVSQVKHHHIITLYDFGMSSQRQPYIVMDFLEGTSLKNIIKDEGMVPFERADHIFQQVIDGLATAHEMDLVHRDLKPENIMLSRNANDPDWVTLVDFGLSKLRDPKQEQDAYQITKVGDVCGSPPYMSPEQCLSSTVVDPRSDIYSLAICVYETLTGKLPFNAKSAIEMLDAHLYATPIPFNQALPELKVCSEVTHVLNKALLKDPETRHQTVQEFGGELHDALSRDALKLRTFKHRIEVANFKDLVSEAEALHKATLENEAIKQVTAQVAKAAADLDGVQFMRNKENSNEQRTSKSNKILSDSGWMSRFQRKNGEDESESTLVDQQMDSCPYCHAPVQSGIKFCVKCNHQLTGPVGQYSATRPSKGDGQGKGFSSKAKVATSKSNSLSQIQKWLTLVLIILVGYGGWTAMHNGELMTTISKLVANVDKK
ncbi:MAG: protein kinase [Candidatus Melainabacteria bacterium]|nr:protein kinase [Candidatus Melainabacteria bacterium]